MSFLSTLFSSLRYFQLFVDANGWFIWLASLAIIVFQIWRWRHYHPHWGNRQGVIFITLFLLVPITTLFIGIHLPSGGALPYPGISIEPEGAAIMLFAALPWMLAAGYLGPAPAAMLAAFSGLLLGYFNTHSLFTPLEYALVATLFSAAVRQKYRTPVFRYLRRPFMATIIVVAIYPVIYTIANILAVGDSLPIGVDFVASRLPLIFAAVTGQLLVGGVLVEIMVMGSRSTWGYQGKLIPSPAETSLESRFLYLLGPIVTVLFLLVTLGVWVVAGRTAESLIRDQMMNTAGFAADSIPFVLETGQTLIMDMASDERLLSLDTNEITQTLQEQLRAVPYFRQLYILDSNGQLITGYPKNNFQNLNLTSQEELGVVLASEGVTLQIYSVPPELGENAGQLSFLTTIKDNSGNIQGVLLGRSGLSSNPFTQPILDSLDQLQALQGVGGLVDPNGIILYHPMPNMLMTTYSGILNEIPTFNQETSPDGTRRLTFNHPVSGSSWAVVISVPAQQIQQQALNIAVPLLGMLLMLALLTYALLRIGLQVVANSLQGLTAQSTRMAAGELDQALVPKGADEIGRLGAAFEEMRLRLKSKLEEANRLLFVSLGVSSTLEMDTAIKPILEAALSTGVTSARVILDPSVLQDFDKNMQSKFGLGQDTEHYSALDEQIQKLSKKQDLVILSNPARAGLQLNSGNSLPTALVSVAIRHDEEYFGALWVAHKENHRFTKDATRFIKKLAGQAEMAIANARLYLNANIGRQRLEAILSSTSDPLLVTDYDNRLLLANPAAMELLGTDSQPKAGMPIKEVIAQKDLLELLVDPDNETASAEIVFPNNRVYYASVSPVAADGKPMGRVTVLRDITYLKELDTLKSDFVNTVSLDLRAPLKLMRGHTTMVETVGELNSQQVEYMRKIVDGIESMSALVNNLLDLGRIEAGVGLHLEKVQINEITAQVLEAMRGKADQKNIALILEKSKSTLPLIEADNALLHQAIRNLIENAIKFTNREGEIQVRITPHQDTIVLSVKDNGIGVAPIDQPRLYERFFRVEQLGEEADKQSSGLGLAIVKSIAEQHGGKIWMESRLGEGSTFNLRIPYRQSES